MIMHKNILICLLHFFLFPLSAYSMTGQDLLFSLSSSFPQNAAETEPVYALTVSSEHISQTDVKQENAKKMSEVKKIRFLAGNKEIVVRLQDHPAADVLYSRLPIKLNFEDFNGTEKIAYPDEELPTGGSPTRCDPHRGSFCYYIPWGNFCFFYRDFRESESLMPLGEVESGLEFLNSLDRNGTVTVEAVE